jgi:hypothetical protein
LKPGTRIVSNHFGITGWPPDETGRTEGACGAWCTSLLYIVPARVAGTWRLPSGELRLDQKFQMLTGTLKSGAASAPIAAGRLRGDQITFTVGGIEYTGRVNGDTIQGSYKGIANGSWTATRVQS